MLRHRFIPTYVGHTGRSSTALVLVRFIPTYVGHTFLAGKFDEFIAVHPHIRGAYNNWSDVMSCNIRFIPTYVGHTLSLTERMGDCTGSSPHTWGILALSALPIFPVRFIPTYVGHTSPETQRFYDTTVHPHIRGAYPSLRHGNAGKPGSSPHTWGIPQVPLRHIVSHRFIPTYVGHTGRKCARLSACSVHPHIRGAYTGPP